MATDPEIVEQQLSAANEEGQIQQPSVANEEGQIQQPSVANEGQIQQPSVANEEGLNQQPSVVATEEGQNLSQNSEIVNSEPAQTSPDETVKSENSEVGGEAEESVGKPSALAIAKARAGGAKKLTVDQSSCENVLQQLNQHETVQWALLTYDKTWVLSTANQGSWSEIGYELRQPEPLINALKKLFVRNQASYFFANFPLSDMSSPRLVAIKWMGEGIAPPSFRSKLVQHSREVLPSFRDILKPGFPNANADGAQDHAGLDYTCKDAEELESAVYDLLGMEKPKPPVVVEEEDAKASSSEKAPSVQSVRALGALDGGEEEAKNSTMKIAAVTKAFKQSLYLHLRSKEPEQLEETAYKARPDPCIPLGRNVKANSVYYAATWTTSGGQALYVAPHTHVGRIEDKPPCVRGQGGQATCFDLSPYDTSLLVVGSPDGMLRLYAIPEGGLKEDLTTPVREISCGGKLFQCAFAPTVANLVVAVTVTQTDSGPGGSVIYLWDIRESQPRAVLAQLVKQPVVDVQWNMSCSLLALSTKDNQVVVVDPRKGVVMTSFAVQECKRDLQLLWVSRTRLLTVGMGAKSMRFFSLWDLADNPNASQTPEDYPLTASCLKVVQLDVSPQIVLPFYDHDSRVLILANSGGSWVTTFEILDAAPYTDRLSGYDAAAGDFVGHAFLPKTAVKVGTAEILRSVKVSRDAFVPVSWRLKRKRLEFFQDDVFPPTQTVLPALSIEQWFSDEFPEGKENELVSLAPPGMTPLSEAPEEEITELQKRYLEAKEAKAKEKEVPAWKLALQQRKGDSPQKNTTASTLKDITDLNAGLRRMTVQPKKHPPPSASSGTALGSSSPPTLVKRRSVVYSATSQAPSFSSNLEVPEHATMYRALANLKADNSDVHWLVIGYKTRTAIGIIASGDTYTSSETAEGGSGGLGAIKQHLPDDAVRFVLLRMEDVLEKVGKVVLATCIGKDVKALEKARCGIHLPDLKSYIANVVPISGEWPNVTGYDDFMDEIKRLKGQRLYTEVTKKEERNKPLQLADPESFQTAVQNLNGDADPTDWVMLGYNDDGGVDVVAKGEKGLEEFSKLLEAPEAESMVRYILLRALIQSAGLGGNVKVVLVTWVGVNVPPMVKAQAAIDRTELLKIINLITTISSELEVSEVRDLDPADITEKITGVRGRIEGENKEGLMSAVASQNRRKFGGMDSSVKLKDPIQIRKVLVELAKSNTSEPEATTWVAFGYVPASEDPEELTVQFLEKGAGGISKWRSLFTDTNVIFGVQRLTLLEHGGIAKAVFVTWVGKDADPLAKARSTGHRMELMDVFKKHITIGAQYRPDSKTEVTDLDLMQRISGGGQESDEKSADDFQYYAKPRQEEIVEQNFIIGVNNLLITFTGTQEKELAALLREVRDGKRDMVKILLRGNDFRRLAVFGFDATQVDIIQGTNGPEKEEKANDEEKNNNVENGNENQLALSEVVVVDFEKEPAALSEEWRAKHLLEHEVCVFVLALQTSEQGYGATRKFLYIQWIGEKIGRFPRGKALEVHPKLLAQVERVLQLSGEMQGCVKPEEVTRDIVLERLTGSKLRAGEMDLTGLTKTEEYKGLGSERKTKLTFDDEEGLKKVLLELVNLEDPLTWIALAYVPGTIDVLQIIATGTDDSVTEGYKQLLQPNNIVFIAHRVTWTIDRDLRKLHGDRSTFYGLLHWIGKQLGLIERAMSAYHWDAFSKFVDSVISTKNQRIQGGHFATDDITEINMDDVRRAMKLYE